jgi:hypothetical protein
MVGQEIKVASRVRARQSSLGRVEAGRTYFATNSAVIVLRVVLLTT